MFMRQDDYDINIVNVKLMKKAKLERRTSIKVEI
jgi:hypothetical protein